MPPLNPMEWIAFAGNPGIKYRKTRHNAGWLCLEALEEDFTPSWNKKFNCATGDLFLEGRRIRLIKPETFMNKIGEALRKVMDFYSLSPRNLLVVHDELELPLGTVQFRKGGGLGGHNGLRSIQQHLGSPDFYRLRLGISRPSRGDVSSWVLSPFSPEEQNLLPLLSQRSSRLITAILTGKGENIINKKINILEETPESTGFSG